MCCDHETHNKHTKEMKEEEIQYKRILVLLLCNQILVTGKLDIFFF